MEGDARPETAFPHEVGGQKPKVTVATQTETPNRDERPGIREPAPNFSFPQVSQAHLYPRESRPVRDENPSNGPLPEPERVESMISRHESTRKTVKMLSPTHQVCPVMCNGGDVVDESDALAMNGLARPLNQGWAGKRKRDGMDELMTGQVLEPQKGAVHIPASLSQFARSANLTFAQALLLLDLQRQIVAHRSRSKSDDLEKVDWKRFYEAVKAYVK